MNKCSDQELFVDFERVAVKFVQRVLQKTAANGYVACKKKGLASGRQQTALAANRFDLVSPRCRFVRLVGIAVFNRDAIISVGCIEQDQAGRA